MHCPLDCPYLREARKHEQPALSDPRTFPNNEIRVTEEFLTSHERLLLFCAVNLLQSSLEIPNVVDSDVADALEALVRTYKTLQSGLYYQSRPNNTLAAAIYDHMQSAVEEFRKSISQQSSMPAIRDAELLGILAFLQRMEIQQRNGRRLGRAFLDFLREHFPKSAQPAQRASSLIV